MRVLLVEDEEIVAKCIKRSLANLYIVDIAYTGKDGEYLAFVNEYDVIILDLSLPDVNGITICKEIRKNNIITPILFLTGSDDLSSKVSALNSGADDYLTKPFHTDELLARLKALLRRNNNLTKDQLIVGDLSLDLSSHVVRRNNTVIKLRKKEFELLEYMMRNQKRVLTRGMILEHVWENGLDEFSNTIDVHIKYLRDKIDRPFKKRYIKTVHGLGYKIE